LQYKKMKREILDRKGETMHTSGRHDWDSKTKRKTGIAGALGGSDAPTSFDLERHRPFVI
jgi:hypothetical protein